MTSEVQNYLRFVFLLLAFVSACKKTNKNGDEAAALVANPDIPLTLIKPASGSAFNEQVAVEWANATAGAPVKIGIANDDTCDTATTFIQESSVPEGVTSTISYSGEGQVYLCVFQDLSSSSRIVAVGSPAAITFDKQAPGDFEISSTSGIIKAADENPLAILPVAWFPSSGATSYVVGISKTSKCANDISQIEIDAPQTTGEFSGLTLNQTDDYYLCAIAKDDAGNATNSKNNGIKFFVDGRAPTNPALSTLTAAGSGSSVTITATWRVAADRGRAGIKRYDLKLVNTATSAEILNSVDSPTVTLTVSAAAVATYDAFVRARDAAGNASTWSSSMQVTTPP